MLKRLQVSLKTDSHWMATRVVWVVALVLTAGCSSEPAVPKLPTKSSAAPPTTKVESPPEKDGDASENPKPAVPNEDNLQQRWSELVAKAHAAAKAEDWDSAYASLEELKKVYAEPETRSEEQKIELAGIEQKLTEELSSRLDGDREEKLADAAKLMEDGKLDEAAEALSFVVARVPSDEQRERASTLRAEIERRRGAQRRLTTWLKLLGSDKRAEVRAAQNELYREPETALPMLLEAVESSDNAALVANSLELLRRMRRPDKAIPAMVGVLRNVDQQANWPAAVSELGRVSSPGAGPLLLDLIKNAEMPEQRMAVLEALAAVSDPPAGSIGLLLPMLFQDGPVLAPALEAAFNTMREHRQFDWISRRGLPAGLSPVEQQQLEDLPARLAKIIEEGEKSDTPSRTVRAARMLAVAARQLEPKPIENIKVLNVLAEYDEGPGTAVLDGVWNSTELTTMWYHPVDKKSTIVLDLGEERTVTSIRIWNFNQPGGTTRGWKEVDVYVSPTPSSIEPVAAGIVPLAPGVAETPDYSTQVAVPFVTGRYVKLTAKSLWAPNSYTGLAEIQVLGF